MFGARHCGRAPESPFGTDFTTEAFYHSQRIVLRRAGPSDRDRRKHYERIPANRHAQFGETATFRAERPSSRDPLEKAMADRLSVVKITALAIAVACPIGLATATGAIDINASAAQD